MTDQPATPAVAALAEALCANFDLGHQHGTWDELDPAGHEREARDDARAILAALPEGWALERLCPECGFPERDWAGHACPGQ